MNINKKALIVEDYKFSQDLLCLYFSDLNWQKPVVVSSGEKALEVLKSKADCFDLIILDLRIPKISGLEVFKEAKKSILNLPPVIVITGNLEDTKIEDEAKELGVKAFLYKGNFEQSDFEEVINTVTKEALLENEK